MILLISCKMVSKSYMYQKNMIPSLLLFLCNVFPRKKYVSCMFCRKIMRCSSSALNGWILLFLLESQICIKHACDNFCTVIICCVEHRKNISSVVWHFSQYKVFSCSWSCHILLFLCRLIHSFKYHKNMMVDYLA